MIEVERLVVATGAGERKVHADHRHFLGAREQPGIGEAARARPHRHRIEQIIGLIGRLAAGFAGREPRMDLRIGVGQQRRRPVLVGEAEPGVGDIPVQLLFVGDFLVGLFLLALAAHHADQAFVQDVIAQRLGGAVTGNQRIRKQRDRAAAPVLHLSLIVNR